MAGTAQDMVNWFKKNVGMNESSGLNYVQRTFLKHNNIGRFNWPWCQATVAVAAYETGCFDSVMFGKWDAYTVTCAQRFKDRGQWVSGTTENCRKAQPGWIVYFDWGGSNDIGRIDHVGIVVGVKGDMVRTLEGNANDELNYHWRSSSVIAGFGKPKYKTVPKPAPWKWNGQAPDGRLILKEGMMGNPVKALQSALNQVMGSKLMVDGEFGPATKMVLKKFQSRYRLMIDGEYGPQSYRKLTLLLV